MKNRFFFHCTNEVLVVVIIIGIIVVFNKGLAKSDESSKKEDFFSSMDSIFLDDCEHILDCVYGVESFGKKRMILSAAAKCYFNEEYSMLDSILPVVNVTYIDDYKGFELYWIAQGSPIDFLLEKNVTDIECMGRYVVLYSIKGQNVITYDSIIQMGYNDNAKSFVAKEFSWYLLIDPKTARNILVKNAFEENDCIGYFDDFIRDLTSRAKLSNAGSVVD